MKAAASAAAPPKKYLRADYCRKNQEPGCDGHLFTLALGGSGNPFISHKALAKIIGSQNSIGMARSPCSAGKRSKWDRWTALGNGTAFRCGAFEAARIAVHRSKFGNPHPRI
jgi:hypothetical protein